MSIPIPGGNMAQKRRLAESVAFTPESESVDDGFSIDEFFDVDRFLAESMDSEPVPKRFPNLELYDILATTVLLVASVAFSIVLTLMTSKFLFTPVCDSGTSPYSLTQETQSAPTRF